MSSLEVNAGAPVLVVSCSLNPASRSHTLAVAAGKALDALGAPHELLDLREWDLPICDGKACYDHPSIGPVTDKVAAAAAILIASPVYNYDLNAAVKNFVELTGQAWGEKPVGFLCAAGGERSYMSPIGLANSLMFDFRCHIVPRYVYATKDDFTAARVPSAELAGRVRQLALAATELAAALRWVASRRNGGAGRGDERD
ncbi:MAG: NAD(P)H-dependent oxidoreductase [Acidobacteria bacterium]|nr:NAD(P)H-dependent oxidoreductase [Acidobacteriota bacterium]